MGRFYRTNSRGMGTNACPAWFLSKGPEHARVSGVRMVILIESEDVEFLPVAVILPRGVPTDLGRDADRNACERRLICQRKSLYRTQQSIDWARHGGERRSRAPVAGVFREAVAEVQVGPFPDHEMRSHVG